MKRIIVIGCPGSGKSTFARALHAATDIPLHYLDMMNWNADRTTVPEEVLLERLRQAMAGDAWIIDGNYGSTIEMRLQACDTVFFLDYPPEVCLDGIASRSGKERPDMPWVDTPGEVDENFIRFIKNYNTESRPAVMDLLRRYADREIHIFTARAEADAFLRSLRL